MLDNKKQETIFEKMIPRTMRFFRYWESLQYILISWRTAVRGGLPSDRTFEGNNPESLVAQRLTGLKKSLTLNLTANEL